MNKQIAYIIILILLSPIASFSQELLLEVIQELNAPTSAINATIEYTSVYRDGNEIHQQIEYQYLETGTYLHCPDYTVFSEKDQHVLIDHNNKEFYLSKVPEEFNQHAGQILDFIKVLDILKEDDQIKKTRLRNIETYSISGLEGFGIHKYRISIDIESRFLDAIYIEFNQDHPLLSLETKFNEGTNITSLLKEQKDFYKVIENQIVLESPYKDYAIKTIGI